MENLYSTDINLYYFFYQCRVIQSFISLSVTHLGIKDENIVIVLLYYLSELSHIYTMRVKFCRLVCFFLDLYSLDLPDVEEKCPDYQRTLSYLKSNNPILR